MKSFGCITSWVDLWDPSVFKTEREKMVDNQGFFLEIVNEKKDVEWVSEFMHAW